MTMSGDPIQSADFDFETNAFVIRKLLRRYRQPHELDYRCRPALGGKTALHIAEELETADNVRELVKAGASVDVVDDRGVSVLVAAQKRRNASAEAGEIFQCLLATRGGKEIRDGKV